MDVFLEPFRPGVGVLVLDPGYVSKVMEKLNLGPEALERASLSASALRCSVA